MKIQPGSIQPTNVVQQDSNIPVTPQDKKEVSPIAPNFHSSAELATSIKSEQSMIASTRATEFQNAFQNSRATPDLKKSKSDLVTKHISPGSDKTLDQLKEQLGSLKNQQQGLIASIQAKMKQIQGAELAGDESGLAEAQAQLQQLQSQLAKVNLEIKEIVGEIEKLQQKEDAEQDRIKSENEAENNISSNLQKAAAAYQDTSDSTNIKP